MAKCSKCNNDIPNKIIIDGKVKYKSKHRKYCFDCSPHNLHNTKKLEDKSDKKECICKQCGRAYIYKRSSGHTFDTCNSCIQHNRRLKFKEDLVALKGGKCIKCGYNKCVNALHFHHLESDKKEINISNIWNKSFDFITKEIEKCVLVCANCHAEIHFEDVFHQ